MNKPGKWRRARQILALLLIISVFALGAALRLVGWPLLHGRSQYTVVPDWPRLPPGLLLGQVTGIDVDSHGRIFVFARGEKVWDSDLIDPALITSPTVYIFDGQTGALLNSWGENWFVMPHGLAIDDGDNVWLTDVGLHQVYKFTPNGGLLLTLGEAGIPGSDATHFNRPTDVAVRADGSFYVSDGYVNSRVVRFDANGRFLTSWHDELQIGRPWAVRVGDDGFVYVVDGGDQNAWLPDRARILKLTTRGEIVDRFGAYGQQAGHFIWPHALAVDAQGALYVTEVGSGQRIQKFIPAASSLPGNNDAEDNMNTIATP